jgi:formylmethanofuran dehydrogenase subunit D
MNELGLSKSTVVTVIVRIGRFEIILRKNVLNINGKTMMYVPTAPFLKTMLIIYFSSAC